MTNSKGYEVILLRNFRRLYGLARRLSSEARRLALRSYDSARVRNGTLGQVQAICELHIGAERLNEVCSCVIRALKMLPAPYRALLVACYIRKVDREQLAARYNVGHATVYRRLVPARMMLRHALEAIGCDERWFAALGDFVWVSRREQEPEPRRRCYRQIGSMGRKAPLKYPCRKRSF